MEVLSLFVGLVSVLVCSIGFEGIEVGFSTSLPVHMHVRVRWGWSWGSQIFCFLSFQAYVLVTNSSINFLRLMFIGSFILKEENVLCISAWNIIPQHRSENVTVTRYDLVGMIFLELKLKVLSYQCIMHKCEVYKRFMDIQVQMCGATTQKWKRDSNKMWFSWNVFLGIEVKSSFKSVFYA